MEKQRSQISKPNPRMRNDDKLSLDDYVSFFDSNKQIDLTARKLMQITSLHGFVQPKSYTKNAVIDALKSIDLMEPSRSTLNDENISSNAFMTLEDVVSDLKQLNWQECCVTSIQTVNSVNYDSVLNTTDAPLSGWKSKRLRTRQISGGTERDAAFDDGAAQISGGSGGLLELVLRRLSDGYSHRGNYWTDFV